MVIMILFVTFGFIDIRILILQLMTRISVIIVTADSYTDPWSKMILQGKIIYYHCQIGPLLMTFFEMSLKSRDATFLRFYPIPGAFLKSNFPYFRVWSPNVCSFFFFFFFLIFSLFQCVFAQIYLFFRVFEWYGWWYIWKREVNHVYSIIGKLGIQKVKWYYKEFELFKHY